MRRTKHIERARVIEVNRSCHITEIKGIRLGAFDIAKKSKLNFIYHYPSPEDKDAIIETLISVVAESIAIKIAKMRLNSVEQVTSMDSNNG
jgi:hypothetical protein